MERKKHYSCETAMVKVFDDIQNNINNNKCIALVTLDSSSAFDTVDHQILIDKLKNQFYVQDEALKLLESYITDRKFCVDINGEMSEEKILKYGVPQGSLLGPLLYILYTSELQSLFKKYNICYHMYADDIQLYLSFKEKEMDMAEEKLNLCLADIKTWMDNNFLKLNTDKTTLKIFNFTNINSNFHLQYNHSKITPLDSVKVLGIMMNKNLERKSFISSKIKTCHYHLKNLWNIERSLTKSSKIILVTNLILSNLDYCNILLLGSTKKELKPRFMFLNQTVTDDYKLT